MPRRYAAPPAEYHTSRRLLALVLAATLLVLLLGAGFAGVPQWMVEVGKGIWASVKSVLPFTRTR